MITDKVKTLLQKSRRISESSNLLHELKSFLPSHIKKDTTNSLEIKLRELYRLYGVKTKAIDPNHIPEDGYDRFDIASDIKGLIQLQNEQLYEEALLALGYRRIEVPKGSPDI
jgi:hypothetical protein